MTCNLVGLGIHYFIQTIYSDHLYYTVFYTIEYKNMAPWQAAAWGFGPGGGKNFVDYTKCWPFSLGFFFNSENPGILGSHPNTHPIPPHPTGYGPA